MTGKVGGLLDISVEFSTEHIVAGKEFALYVLVKNPYQVPVWIQSVSVNVPSDIDLPQWTNAKQNIQQALSERRQERERQAKEYIESEVERRLRMQELERVLKDLESSQSTDVEREQKMQSARRELAHLRVESEKATEFLRQFDKASITVARDAKVRSIEISPLDRVNLTVDEKADVGSIQIGPINIVGGQEVDLHSSLPKGSALQPGDTAVFTVLFRTKSKMLFRPTQFKFRVSIVYSAGESIEPRVNTASVNVEIRAPMESIILGSIVGGILGFGAKYLQLISSDTSYLVPTSMVLNLLLAIMLSIAAVVFTARKSNTQSFVSVEDFWGGVMIGFLVGFSGLSAFQGIAGIETG